MPVYMSFHNLAKALMAVLPKLRIKYSIFKGFKLVSNLIYFPNPAGLCTEVWICTFSIEIGFILCEVHPTFLSQKIITSFRS